MGMSQWDRMPTWKKTVLIMTSLPFLIAARALWQAYPTLWACVLFWIVALVDDPLRFSDMGPRRKFCFTACFVGGLSNAVATLANGGVMPVLGKTDTTSLWVPLTESTRVPYLCDVMAGGSSIGDWFIIAGLLSVFSVWLLEKGGALAPELVAEGKRIPGFGIG